MKIVIVAGGTGGHLFPGIAVAHRLRHHEVIFVVRRGDLGREILQKEGFQIREIAGQGLPRDWSWRIVSFPFQFLQGWRQAGKLLRDIRPDAVLAMGGYLSVPVVLQARRLGIRTLLHEQNVFPGLANRILSRWADSTAISFSQSASYFKGSDVWVSGLPIRTDIGQVSRADGLQKFGLAPEPPTYLVFGGSLGAQRLNSCTLEAWRLLVAEHVAFQVIHITGPKDFERIQALYRSLAVSAKVMPFCHEMAHAYAAANAVLCRAGASTIAEILAARRPALVVPYPHASNNHQAYNADVIEQAGWGKIILDKALNAQSIANFFRSAAAWHGKEKSETPSGDAADRIATHLTRHPS